jgi:transketolase
MQLRIIPKEEFDRIRSVNIDKYDKLQLFADMCRYNTFVEVKKAGSGHLGSSLSAMDIIVYLYLEEMNTMTVGFVSEDRDVYFSSKGHDVPGLYSLFYALGVLPLERLMKLRRFGGLDGHPEVRIDGIEANSGSLGMGISKGKGMAWAKDISKNSGRIFVLTGDGEFQEGQIFESLQATVSQDINNITVIIDRNKFQTDMLVDEVNSIEDLVVKVSAFGWHVERCNGHDFRDIEKTLNKIQDITYKPKFIIADTIKGRGISFMEQPYKSDDGITMYKWHSGAPDDAHFENGVKELEKHLHEKCDNFGIGTINYIIAEEYEKASGGVSTEFVKNVYGEALCELGETHPELVVLDGDLSADCGLRPFEKKFPYRFIENGIAEQDMASTAGGIARMGLLPVVNSFGTFLASRANEQIFNNATEETKIIYTMHFAGLIPAGPGKSHQSVRDISLMGAIPNMVIIQPCNAFETKEATRWCVESAEENCTLRLVIGPSPRIIDLPDDYRFEMGKGTILKNGFDAIIFAYGPVMLHEALTASEILEQNDFTLKVVNMPWLNRFNKECLTEVTNNIFRIFVLEDHSTFGGLGDSMLYELMQHRDMTGTEFKKFGLDEYPECGTPPEVLKYHRLDGRSLAERILGKKIDDNFNTKSRYTEDAPQ